MKTHEHVIGAQCCSDDYVVKISFDAESWFKLASDLEIVNLAKINFRGDYEADSVAECYADTTTKRLFDYLVTNPAMMNGDPVGFECVVDPDDATRWIRKHRPHLLDEVEI